MPRYGNNPRRKSPSIEPVEHCTHVCGNTEPKSVGFFRLMATVFLFLVILSIPAGASQECVECEPENEFLCVLYRLYVILLQFLLRINEIVQCIFGLIMNTSSNISRELIGQLRHTESVCIKSSCQMAKSRSI